MTEGFEGGARVRWGGIRRTRGPREWWVNTRRGKKEKIEKKLVGPIGGLGSLRGLCEGVERVKNVGPPDLSVM